MSEDDPRKRYFDPEAIERGRIVLDNILGTNEDTPEPLTEGDGTEIFTAADHAKAMLRAIREVPGARELIQWKLKGSFSRAKPHPPISFRVHSTEERPQRGRSHLKLLK